MNYTQIYTQIILFASAPFAFHWALQDSLGQQAVAGDMAIPVQPSSFDHSKEKILPASVLGDLLPDKIVCPVFCE